MIKTSVKASFVTMDFVPADPVSVIQASSK